jgi:hypothetical protein
MYVVIDQKGLPIGFFSQGNAETFARQIGSAAMEVTQEEYAQMRKEYNDK